MKNRDLAIIVLSCDKFSSLWPLFFSRFNKFFPPEIANIYLLSNFLNFDSYRGPHSINVIKVGEDISWSSNLRKCVELLKEKNLLLLMDDVPLSKAVEINKFKKIYNAFISDDMDYINLKSSPPPNINICKDYGRLSCDASYRTAIVPSFWKKKILLELLNDEETAWQFEIFGSTRSKGYKNFFSVNSPVFEFDHIVIKGKIDRKVYNILKANDEHHNLDFSVMNRLEYLKYSIKHLIGTKIIPRSIMSYYGKIKYK